MKPDKEGRNLIYKSFALESTLVVALIVASILIPTLKAELFPYSSFALFTDSPKLYVEYEIFDALGNPIAPKEVALHRNYYGISPREPYARVKPFSYDKFGVVLDSETIEKAVLENSQNLKLPVTVKQMVFEWSKGGVKNTQTFTHIVAREQVSGH